MDFEEKNKNSSKSLMNSCGKFLHSPTIEKKNIFRKRSDESEIFSRRLRDTYLNSIPVAGFVLYRPTEAN